MSGEKIIIQSSVLRGQGRYDEAINIIESNIGIIDDDIKVNAWLEALYAAEEKGAQQQAKEYALLIANKDPNIPSIKKYM